MNTEQALVLFFPESQAQAAQLARSLGVSCCAVDVHQFPDEESLIRLPATVPDNVIVYRSLDRPNSKLIELILAARTARELGAKQLTLVAPYLCYMRQDIANHPGEAVSQRIIGKLLADHFDNVITVDPHLHRISKLSQAIPIRNAIALSAMQLLSDYIKSQLSEGILLGPDAESEQWVAQVAKSIGFDFGVATKKRFGDRKVEIQLPEKDFHNRSVVIIDDVASTGKTVALAAELLYARGAANVYLAVTHALFSEGALETVQKANVREIWSTDSITHETNCVRLSSLLAASLKNVI